MPVSSWQNTLWKAELINSAFFINQSSCPNLEGHISLCIWGISPTIFVSLPQQNCFISPTICFVSPTKLLHFPNNLSHFPNNLCHFPNTFSHFPNNFVSLCPPPKNHDFFKKNLGFHILISLHHFKKKLNRFWGFRHACLVCLSVFIQLGTAVHKWCTYLRQQQLKICIFGFWGNWCPNISCQVVQLFPFVLHFIRYHLVKM